MPDPYRCLITGSRDWSDEPAVWKALAETLRPIPIDREIIIVTGACPTGADEIAEEWGRGFGATIERHPADWDNCTPACPPYGARAHRRWKKPDDTVHPGLLDTYCPTAGPRRNRELVALGADIALAFIKDGSRGASHTADLAEQAGIPTRRFTA
ncbi:DUF2493 domain-containing protein [Streptomyces caniscabiei]|uniref:DUF2493 domain-containing protein n=1 Tax=Streptomyces caniscabiei TaxID=2746961 RepID=A0ABU4MRM7_9ACTN|nr:DUF2493 domain-containing protein [Streptomyces caniscabiei]MBE4788441.1 DUF2493 domain-containing protein [Streptomyces caniscabiei]MDX3039422.1 DUF2493 domain-containing protein [Streptomyces caniscabiei]